MADRTANQSQLCPSQNGIQIKVGHVEAVHGGWSDVAKRREGSGIKSNRVHFATVSSCELVHVGLMQ